MITPGFEFDKKPLREVEGPLPPEARNLSQDDLQRTGYIETTNQRGKIVKYSLKDWTSSAYSQKGLPENWDQKDSFDLFIICLGELAAFQLAVRSFCNEVCFIQSNLLHSDFLPLLLGAVEDFEFDLMVAVKV